MALKYKRGRRIDTVARLVELLQAEQYVFMDGSPKHPMFLRNLPLKKMQDMVRIGAFYEADLRKPVDKDEHQHLLPDPHDPQWMLDLESFAICQYPGCRETKQFGSRAEVEDNISKQRNYKQKKVA